MKSRLSCDEQAENLRESLERNLAALAKRNDPTNVLTKGAQLSQIKVASLMLEAVDWAISGLALASATVPGALRVEAEQIGEDVQLFSVYRGDRLVGALELYTATSTTNPLIGCGVRYTLADQGKDSN